MLGFRGVRLAMVIRDREMQARAYEGAVQAGQKPALR